VHSSKASMTSAPSSRWTCTLTSGVKTWRLPSTWLRKRTSCSPTRTIEPPAAERRGPPPGATPASPGEDPGDLADAVVDRSPEREDLEAARVGHDRAVPPHEAVDAAVGRHPLGAGPEVEVVGVGEEHLGAALGHPLRIDALDGGLRPHPDEGGRLDGAVGGAEAAAAAAPWLRSTSKPTSNRPPGGLGGGGGRRGAAGAVEGAHPAMLARSSGCASRTCFFAYGSLG
jgi:hypothetical protein